MNFNDIKGERIEINFQDKKSVIILGANGTGKSSLARYLFKQVKFNSIYIPSQKDLYIPTDFTFKDQGSVLKETGKTRGLHGKNNFTIDSAEDNNEMIDDFEQVITYLIVQDTEEYSQFGKKTKQGELGIVPESIFDVVKKIWEKVFVGSSLSINEGKIKLNTYDIKSMSDGERSALYLIAKCLLKKKVGFIIIDEPESHINSALLYELWSWVEYYRPETKFIYLTHNIEFVESKFNSIKLWIRSFRYDSNDWDIISLDDHGFFSEEVLVKIIGTKKQKIIFCEGEKFNGTRDHELYKYLYPDFKVISIGGGCGDVIKTVKSLRKFGQVYNKEFFGIIDRDFRLDEEIIRLAEDKIFVLPVAQYENIFLMEEILSFLKIDGIDKITTKLIELLYEDDYLRSRKKNFIKNKFNEYSNAFFKNPILAAEFKFSFDVFSFEKEEVTNHNEILKILKYKKITQLPRYLEIKDNLLKETESVLFSLLSPLMPKIL